MPGRTFTPEQASRTLPFVSRVMEDVVRVYRRMRRRVTLYRRLKRLRTSAVRMKRIHARIERLGRRIVELQRELDGVGCQLVDFPGTRDGRAIELCWRLGEPEVAFWHHVGAGYLARQPLRPEPAPR